MFAHTRRVRLLGTGVATRDNLITSAAIDARLGLAAGTVGDRTGVRARDVEVRRNAAEMGADAARRALDAAGLTIDDIDCVVGASGTPDQAMPCNAALLLHALGSRGAATPAFDINATCLSFLVALDTIGYLVDAGRYRRVLIANAVVSAAFSALPALFSEATPALIMSALFFAGGLSRSLQFTGLNTISFADIPEAKLSRATSFASVLQELAGAVGVTFAALGLELAMRADGAHEIGAQHFPAVFIAVSAVALVSAALFAVKLDAEAGASLLAKPDIARKGAAREEIAKESSDAESGHI